MTVPCSFVFLNYCASLLLKRIKFSICFLDLMGCMNILLVMFQRVFPMWFYKSFIVRDSLNCKISETTSDGVYSVGMLNLETTGGY